MAEQAQAGGSVGERPGGLIRVERLEVVLAEVVCPVCGARLGPPVWEQGEVQAGGALGFVCEGCGWGLRVEWAAAPAGAGGTPTGG